MLDRRTAIRAVAGGTVVGLAGCSGTNGRVSFTATVTREPSETAPARVDAELANGRGESTAVQFGPALLFTDDRESTYEWADAVGITPETDVGAWPEPEYVDSCWRVPADEQGVIRSRLRTRSMPAGASITESYDVYTRESGSCLPSGQFRFRDGITVGDERRVLTLVVDTDGGVSASGRIE